MTKKQLKKEVLKNFEELRTNSYEEPLIISDEEAEDIKSFLSSQLDYVVEKMWEEIKVDEVTKEEYRCSNGCCIERYYSNKEIITDEDMYCYNQAIQVQEDKYKKFIEEI